MNDKQRILCECEGWGCSQFIEVTLEEGMEIKTHTPTVIKARRMNMQLLLACVEVLQAGEFCDVIKTFYAVGAAEFCYARGSGSDA